MQWTWNRDVEKVQKKQKLNMISIFRYSNAKWKHKTKISAYPHYSITLKICFLIIYCIFFIIKTKVPYKMHILYIWRDEIPPHWSLKHHPTRSYKQCHWCLPSLVPNKNSSWGDQYRSFVLKFVQKKHFFWSIRILDKSQYLFLKFSNLNFHVHRIFYKF